MLETLIGITSSVYFSIGAGILLLWLFICILKAVDSPNRRKWGFIFLIGLLGFSLNFFYTQVKQQRIHSIIAEELMLTVLPETDETSKSPIPLTKENVKEACDTLGSRLYAQEIKDAQLSYSGDKICVCIPRLHRDKEKNKALMDELTTKLSQRAKLMILKVHHDSYNLRRNADYIRIADAYIAALHRYNNAEERAQHNPSYINTEKHPSKTNFRRLPHSLGIKGYQLTAEQINIENLGEPITTEDGRCVYDYEILQTPVSAQLEGIYISEQHIHEASLDIARHGYLSVTLTDEGAKRMEKLTSSLNLGYDRLGIVINEMLKCAPTVQSVISKEFSISGLNGKDEAKMLAEAFSYPLYHDLKVEKRCETTLTHTSTVYNTTALYTLIGLLGFFGICYFGNRLMNHRKQA